MCPTFFSEDNSVTRIHDAAASTGVMAAGISGMEIGYDYFILAVIGGMIGLIRWFHAYSHSEPKWSRGVSLSEALVSVMFGFIAMPAAIRAAGENLAKYNLCYPELKILIGAFAAFFAVELTSILIGAIKARSHQ